MRQAGASSAADLDAQFTAITAELAADLRRLTERVERYRGTYQRQAEAAREVDPGTLGQIREAHARLQRLDLAVARIEASLNYVIGIAEAPSQADETRDMAARVLDGLEAERQRLYREVHDGPAQVLTNAVFEMEFFERIADRAPADVRAQLLTEVASLKGQLRESLENTRAIIFDLRPPALAQLGLVEAMRAYAAEFQSRFGLIVETDLRPGPTGLSAEQELAVYRVLQEAMQNVHRHASARRVRVGWNRKVGRWVLDVSDDGSGFDVVRAARQAKSFGLLTMRERAEVIGGNLEIHSAPGAGTSVVLSLPSAA